MAGSVFCQRTKTPNTVNILAKPLNNYMISHKKISVDYISDRDKLILENYPVKDQKKLS